MLHEEEIRQIIDADKQSERKRQAKVAQRYYDGDHDIKGLRFYYRDAHGKLVEDTTRSNIKTSHPFFTELVDQCVQYMLSGNDPIVQSDDQSLQAELDAYFGDDFLSELSETLTDTCINGFGYVYAQKVDDYGDVRTAFRFAEGMGVVEVHAKDVLDATDHVVYWYVDRIGPDRKQITRVQVWDEDFTWYYASDGADGDIVPDPMEAVNPRPHILYEKDGAKWYDNLGYIPFFRIDANRKQQSHIKPIKEIIDDYDLMNCGLSNNIQDFADALYVVKGFEGEDLEELIENVNVKKRIGVPEGGDVDVKTVDIPYDARMRKMEVDEKDIYRFGMGFNSAQVGDGNITNIVIKSRYFLLDLKCDKLERNLRKLMKRLVSIALDEINGKRGEGWRVGDVRIGFGREVMTNASDNAQMALTEAQTQQARVATLLNAATAYGDDAVLESVCAELDLDADEVRKAMQEEGSGGLGAAVSALSVDG